MAISPIDAHRASSRRRLVALVALATSILACGQGPSPTGSSDPAGVAGPVTAIARRDGVVVTLTVSTAQAETGIPIQVRVEILNVGPGPVTWQSGGCELFDGFRLRGPDIPTPPDGRTWAGTAGLAKWSATTIGVALDGIRSAKVPEGVAIGCPADLRYDDIGPGQTVAADAVWSGKRSDGATAPPGAYQFAYDFPFIGRMAAEQVVADPPALTPIEVVAPVVVTGDVFTGLPGTLAWDAAMPKERLYGAEIRLVDGHWRFTIHEGDDHVATILVDQTTGDVDEVSLPD